LYSSQNTHLWNQTKPKPRERLVILSIIISALLAPWSLNSVGVKYMQNIEGK
jgi:hypothetical protein